MSAEIMSIQVNKFKCHTPRTIKMVDLDDDERVFLFTTLEGELVLKKPGMERVYIVSQIAIVGSNVLYVSLENSENRLYGHLIPANNQEREGDLKQFLNDLGLDMELIQEEEKVTPEESVIMDDESLVFSGQSVDKDMIEAVLAFLSKNKKDTESEKKAKCCGGSSCKSQGSKKGREGANRLSQFRTHSSRLWLF